MGVATAVIMVLKNKQGARKCVGVLSLRVKEGEEFPRFVLAQRMNDETMNEFSDQSINQSAMFLSTLLLSVSTQLLLQQ